MIDLGYSVFTYLGNSYAISISRNIMGFLPITFLMIVGFVKYGVYKLSFSGGLKTH